MRPYQVRRSKNFLMMIAACLAMYSSLADSTHHALSAKQSVDYAMKNSTGKECLAGDTDPATVK